MTRHARDLPKRIGPWLALVLLTGCSPWTWRAARPYPPTEAAVPTFSGLADADLAVEAYAIGRAELEDRDLDALRPRLSAGAARAGAHALVIDAVEAVTSTWNTSFTPRERDAGVVERREEIRISQSSTRVEATALRNPTACLGLAAVCDRPYAAQTCQARVLEGVADGPALAAGLQPGNLVLAVDGRPVAHPWDLHQRVDLAPPGTSHTLRIEDDEGQRDVAVVSAACAGLYPP